MTSSTQARTPIGATGSDYLNATQIPTARTFPAMPPIPNTMDNGYEIYPIVDAEVYSGTLEVTNSNFVYNFVAKAPGRIRDILVTNSATGSAINGTFGLRMYFKNLTNASAKVADFGFGSGSNAVAANDSVASVATNSTATLSNSLAADATGSFNQGDVIQVTATNDSTGFLGRFLLGVSYESKGRS